MSVQGPRDPADLRDRVVVFLGLMSSPEAQRRCAGAVEPERLAFELCRVWIEEVFTPGWTVLGGWKGDRDAEAVRRFWAAFTEEEREALERFHRFVELRVEMLPEEDRDAGRFPQNDRWDNLVRDAANTLEELEAEAELLRSRLARVVGVLTGDRGEDAAPDWAGALRSRTGP